MWVPRTRYFVEDPRKRFQEVEVFGFRRFPIHLSMLQEVGILLTLVLLSIFLLIFGLKEWKELRGCLGFKYKISSLARCFHLGEGVSQGEGQFLLSEGVRQGEWQLHLGKPDAYVLLMSYSPRRGLGEPESSCSRFWGTV